MPEKIGHSAYRDTFILSLEGDTILETSKFLQFRKHMRKNWPGYLLVLPIFIAILVLNFYPLLNGILLSFKSYNLLKSKMPGFNKFIGFDNYKYIFTNGDSIRSIRQTIEWTLVNIVVQVIVAMFLSLALNKKIKGRSFFRTVTLIPWAIPSAIAAMTFIFVYDSKIGPLNILLSSLGLIDKFVAWLGNTNTAFPAVMFISIWKGVPFQMIFILAALQGIPQEIYESAVVDGSNKRQTFFRITLPMIKEPFAISVILNMIGILNNFNAIWLTTKGGPLYSTEILDTFAYREAFVNYKFGTAAASSVVLFLFTAVFAIIYIRLISRED